MSQHRGGQTSIAENAESRHRSGSRRVSVRHGYQPTSSHGRLGCSVHDHPGNLKVGCHVQCFSFTADSWVKAEVVDFPEINKVRLEYLAQDFWCTKTLHVHSEHVLIPNQMEGVVPQAMVHSDALDMAPTGGDEAGNQTTSHEQLDDLREAVIAVSPGGEHGAQHSSVFEEVVPSAPLRPGQRDELSDGMTPTDFYLGCKCILEMLECGDVVLMKGSWLLDCYRNKAVLPRRQELPPEAIFDYHTLVRSLKRGLQLFPFIVSISHCWYEKAHPDPEGLQLQELGPTPEARLAYGDMRENRDRGLAGDIAVFWCWCSYYQEPRTSDQQKAFERSFVNMDLWYTNCWIEVWMLTKVPTHVQNKIRYHDRGWTTWESTCAKMLCALFDDKDRQRAPLDLSLLDNAGDESREPCGDRFCGCAGRTVLCYERIRTACTTSNTLPVLPKSFDKIIDGKTFTKGESDKDKVKANYRKNFKQVMAAVSVMCFKNLSKFDTEQLTDKILRYCSNLKKLSLSSKDLNELYALTDWFEEKRWRTKCPKLERVEFHYLGAATCQRSLAIWDHNAKLLEDICSKYGISGAVSYPERIMARTWNGQIQHALRPARFVAR